MRVRGNRECQDCGARWSYYDTGSVACPDCGSVHSVGVDERALHTDGDATLDLTEARRAADERSLPEAAERAASACRAYVRRRGFVSGGDLLALDDTYLAARELTGVGETLRRALSWDDATELYFLSLLRGAADGDRPAAADVPADLRGPRGLAAADAVEAYRRDLAAWLDEHPDPAARETLSELSVHERRIRALDGAVPPAEADRLVAAARDVGRYLGADGGEADSAGGGAGASGSREEDHRDEAVAADAGDEAALARAKDRLARLGGE